MVSPDSLLVYIANPLGFSDAGRAYLKVRILPKFTAASIPFINPFDSIMELDTAALKQSSGKMTLETALGIGKQNVDDIDRSTNIFAVLDGVDVDSGTAAEIGYGYAKGKKITGYRGDFRAASDAESCRVNLQVEAFIRLSGGRVYDSLDLAIDEIESDLK